MSTLVLVTACEKAPAQQPRLFTDSELSVLEARVLAAVNKSTRDCVRPEALALWKPTGDLAACVEQCDVLDYGADHEKPIRRDELHRIATPEAAALDAKCGALVSAAFGRAAVNPGCSPFQIGIDNLDLKRAIRMHVVHLLARHAHAQSDRAAAARSLVAGLHAYQDYARGQTSFYTVEIASIARSRLAFDLLELLADARFTPEDLDALATSLDHLIASEPPLSNILQADATHSAFEYGLLPLKGPTWPVPGGRTDSMLPSVQPSTSHDPRDAAGIMMLYALEMGELFRSVCPPTASHRECFAQLGGPPTAEGTDLLDRPRKGDAATRARVKRELVDSYLASISQASMIAGRANDIVPLVALRLRIEILRNGRCPTADELDVPPYSTLRAPSVLGDSIPVTPVEHALRVDLPAWVRNTIEQDRKDGQSPPAVPSRKILDLPCP